MRPLQYLLIPVIYAICQVAVATVPVLGTPAENKYSRAITPPQGKVIVYIYQRPEDGEGVSPKIWLNNYEIGRLVPGSFTVWKMSPGQLEVRVDGPDPTSLTLVSTAGKTYLFRLSYTQTALGSRVQLEGLPGSYRAELDTSQLIKNPKQVTEVVAQVPVKPAQPAAKPVEKVAEPEQKPVAETRSVPGEPIQPGGVTLMLKTGSYTLSEKSQTLVVQGVSRTLALDENATGLYAIEGVYQFESGLTVGGELIAFNTSYTVVGSGTTGNVDVLTLTATTRQYFRTDASLQPFIGAGVGIATADLSGAVSGSTFGLAYQLSAGIEYRTANVGIFGEYKYVAASTEDSSSQKVDVSGSGIFAGIAFHF